jgi:hypothetical protein
MPLEIERPCALAPTLLDAIASIVVLRAQREVLQIAAWRVVTDVHHDHPFGDRPMRRLPGDTVGETLDSAHPYDAIAPRIPKSRPQMASGHLVDLHMGAHPSSD